MTKQQILATVKYAKAANNAGDCFNAQQAIVQAWAGLSDYAQATANKPSLAASVQRKIAAVHTAITRKCAAGEGLMTPQFGAVYGMVPDKIWLGLGVGLSVLGLALGIHAMAKS